ncbi:N-acetylmuramoyl-L-alanine amidase CwlA [Sedimentibacter acidaminivorans]|uniref:N-acetylmuramoyl-L-alanine amidase n=1 Tax=Sedimentibacter acidaminivorans TaxID=913099 RepID=A0ABS4GA74_9FIRM|nr:N-acetylmuramoyl-L-alanine amidase [Sedimentibacter acidaminivorans]MBP1924576.1 N-acetylmuramoyl-L-alanine amidase CwlA [Sedimentibacter acidaminivorans]
MKIENGLIKEFNISGIKFAQDLIPITNKLARSQLAMKPQHITLHNPASGNATAQNLTDYADSYSGYKSWHLTIIGINVFQELPFNEVSWNAGDGYNGPGNRSSISLEIGEDEVSENTAKVFVAYLMKEYNIPIEKVLPHKIWSGKNCPAYTLPHWDSYIKSIDEYYKEITKKPHWAEKNKLSLENKGIAINDTRYDDFMTRGEVFALLDRIIK